MCKILTHDPPFLSSPPLLSLLLLPSFLPSFLSSFLLPPPPLPPLFRYNDSQYWETPDEEENPFLDSSYHGEVNDNEVNAKVGEDTMQANPGSEIAMTASKKEMASE